eukprot:g65729.t1
MVLVFVILAVKGPNSDFFARVHLQDPDQLEQVTVRLLWAAFAHLALVVPVLVLPSISWGQLLTINRKMAIQCLVHSLYMVFPSIFVFSLYGGCVQCQGLDRYQYLGARLVAGPGEVRRLDVLPPATAPAPHVREAEDQRALGLEVTPYGTASYLRQLEQRAWTTLCGRPLQELLRALGAFLLTPEAESQRWWRALASSPTDQL